MNMWDTKLNLVLVAIFNLLNIMMETHLNNEVSYYAKNIAFLAYNSKLDTLAQKLWNAPLFP